MLVLPQPVHLVLETLDVIHAGLENRSLVRPRVAHYLEERIRILGQQTAQLFDAVIDVEASPPLNWSERNKKNKERKINFNK